MAIVTTDMGTQTTELIAAGVISGAITSGTFASGVSYQGYPMTRRAVMRANAWGTVSGAVAVCIDLSGNAQIAQSAISGGMPAMGFNDGIGALSGQVIEFVTHGIAVPTSGLNCTRIGRPVFVNASGYVGNISGGFLSGGFGATTDLSGALCQCLGISIHSGAIYVNPQFPATSGLPLLPIHAL